MTRVRRGCFLIALFDGGGNVPTELAIARELVERGNRVRVLAPRPLRERVEATGATFAAYVHAPEHDSRFRETDLIRDWEARTRPGEFVRVRDNVIFGTAMAFARDVIAELDREPADVVASDSLILGALMGAEVGGGRKAALFHTLYPLPTAGIPPYGFGLSPARGRAGRVRDALLTRVWTRAFAPGLKVSNKAAVQLGVEPAADISELLGRTDLALVLTSPEFDFAGRAALPPNVRYTGAVVDRDSVATGFDGGWGVNGHEPLVVASFCTSFMNLRPLASRVIAALGELPVRGLVTTGPAVDLSGVPTPRNVVVREWVPHAAVLPEARLLVTHGGLGTVMGALAHGVPLVCLPSGRDQYDNAARVVAAEAGVRLRARSSTRRLSRAIAAAVVDDRIQRGARKMAASLEGENGVGVAADELEKLGRGG